MKHREYMQLGFPKLRDVSGRSTIADLYPNKTQRTGIYLLAFPEGDYYAGQSVDVVRRFAEHLKTKGAISGFSFMPVRESELDEVERFCVNSLQHRCRLRNIELVASPQVETDFDTVIARDVQENWLKTGLLRPVHYKRNSDKVLWNELQARYHDRAAKLLTDSCFCQYALPVMRKYMLYGIPEPFMTELSFWSCSCVPKSTREIVIFSRINLRSCEVFTVGYHKVAKEPFYSFHLARSVFEKNYNDGYFLHQYPSAEIYNHIYRSAGLDQCKVVFSDFDEVMAALENPAFLYSVKFFNLGQMRRGAHLYYHTHCIELAEAILPV